MRIAFRNIESQLGRRENPPSHKSQRHRGLVYLFGAICPDRAVGAAMITPGANTEAMNLHLTEIR